MSFRFLTREEYVAAMVDMLDDPIPFDQEQEAKYEELAQEYIEFCKEKTNG